MNQRVFYAMANDFFHRRGYVLWWFLAGLDHPKVVDDIPGWSDCG